MAAVDQSKYHYITQQDYDSVAGPDWPSYADFCQHQQVPDFVYQEIDTMLLKPQAFDHPSFCVLPFYGMEFWAGAKQKYPSNTFCCLVPDGQDRESVKQDMLAGKRPQACEVCWKLEDQGVKSDRQIKNETVDFYLQKNIQQLFEDCQQGKDRVIHYKIDSNNICNATCVTCDSSFSTSWAQLEKKNGGNPHRSWQILPEQLDLSIDYATAKSIGFRGGEPFLSSGTWHVLQQLLKHNNHDCFVNFTTNGSIKLNQEQKNILSQFKNVNFCFSIDGVGSVFEYLRYPLHWPDLETNIQYCRDNNILISANYTISNLNILYYSQTVEWFEKNQINFHTNPVAYPLHFRPSVLPKQVKLAVLNQQKNNPVVRDLLDLDNPASETHFDSFQQRIAEQDLWKGISMQNYLPELCRLLG